MTWVVAALTVALIVTVAWGLERHSRLRRLGGPATPDPQTGTMIAHEMKNPLMAIKGLAATGRRHYESMSEEERREFFELINEEADRLISIIEQTAMAMRIEAGDVEYDLRPEPLAEVINETLARAPLGKHPVSVEVEADPGLAVICDRERTVEVLESLLDNAAKFSPDVAPISVRAYRGDRSAVIEVADRGPGISPEERERVFERYSSTRPRGYEGVPGAGLSLFIARAHARAQGGSIRADGAEGEGGTILRLTLLLEVASTG